MVQRVSSHEGIGLILFPNILISDELNQMRIAKHQDTRGGIAMNTAVGQTLLPREFININMYTEIFEPLCSSSAIQQILKIHPVGLVHHVSCYVTPTTSYPHSRQSWHSMRHLLVVLYCTSEN